MLPLRIAILICDRPMPLTEKNYGSYAGCLKILLEASAKAMKDEFPGIESDLTLTTYDVSQGEEFPNLGDIDAILMTGSRFNAYDDTPWILKLTDFVSTVLAQDRVRIIGVCFGHQIIGRALGIPVVRGEHGWEISVFPISLTPSGRELFKGRLQPDSLSIMQMHKDLIEIEPEQLPDGVENLATTEVCKIHGLYKKGVFISVQGHPEYTPDIMHELITVREKSGVFTKEMAKDGMKNRLNPQDGVVVGSAFLRFLIE